MGGDITGIFFGKRDHADDVVEETVVIKKAANQLDEYFAGRRRSFDLPLAYHGTGFRKSVWDSLRAIPYGQTRSYKEVAAAVGNPNACRAVGMANHNNPIAIVIPCHRVINQGGNPGGYAGGPRAKEYLLELEKRYG
jgi:methylated-DNA-[protein]-cysteine S-methyltransferase